MSTVGAMSGIDISSLLEALTGASTPGIDVNTAVAAAIDAMEAPEEVWLTQQQTLQSQSSALNSVESDVTALSTAISALQDPDGALGSMTVSSSNSEVLSASASAGTAVGNHVITVSQLATTASWYSDTVANGSTNLTPGGFSLQVGSGAPVNITIGQGVNTLSQLATDINGQKLGVTASVVQDASGSRLAIVSNESGAANNISITNDTGLNFTQAEAGQDASLTVDGIPLTSSSNTVTGAVSGLTLNLLGAAPGTRVELTVAPDSTAATTAINNFVSAYNTVMGDVNTQFTFNQATQTSGPLAGDSTMSMLQDALLGAGSYSATGNSAVTTLASLGISMNDDGTLTADSNAVSNAVQNNFSAVQQFFQGTNSNGFASALNTQLNSLTDSTGGAFTVDLQSISTENKDLQTQINNFQAYVNTQQTLLQNEYSQAEIALQELPEKEAQLQQELGNSSGSSK